MKKRKHGFFKRNGLSLVALSFMVISLVGQFFTGWNERNKQLCEENKQEMSIGQYAQSGHFIQATFENWESEFLQMALYVMLTVFLIQKGSAESKDPDAMEDVDREPKLHPNAPWPVKKGGIWLRLYSHSLSIILTLFFLISFAMHFYGSLKDHNQEQMDKMLPAATWSQYITESRFWFESFQNWQSEFMSIAAIVLLSIWFREKGSPESKPVDAAHEATGN